MAAAATPVVEGWFVDDEPTLTGLRCTECGTVVFPPRAVTCPSPACRGDELTSVALSRTGTVWSYATNHYPPPPPYVVVTEPYEPVTVVAVELEEEGLVVLGQLDGDVGDVQVGTPVELGTTTLSTDDDGTRRTVWCWRVVA